MFWNLVLRYRNKIATICLALIAAVKLFWAIWYRGEKIEQINTPAPNPPDPQVYEPVPAQANEKMPVMDNQAETTTIESTSSNMKPDPQNTPADEPSTDDLNDELKDAIKKAE